jgi:hypothetical protein
MHAPIHKTWKVITDGLFRTRGRSRTPPPSTSQMLGNSGWGEIRAIDANASRHSTLTQPQFEKQGSQFRHIHRSAANQLTSRRQAGEDAAADEQTKDIADWYAAHPARQLDRLAAHRRHAATRPNLVISPSFTVKSCHDQASHTRGAASEPASTASPK